MGSTAPSVAAAAPSASSRRTRRSSLTTTGRPLERFTWDSSDVVRNRLATRSVRSSSSRRIRTASARSPGSSTTSSMAVDQAELLWTTRRRSLPGFPTGLTTRRSSPRAARLVEPPTGLPALHLLSSSGARRSPNPLRPHWLRGAGPACSRSCWPPAAPLRGAPEEPGRGYAARTSAASAAPALAAIRAAARRERPRSRRMAAIRVAERSRRAFVRVIQLTVRTEPDSPMTSGRL